VVPGDQLKLRVTKLKQRGSIHKYACIAEVDGVKVAEAEVAAMVGFPDEDESGV
jgi:3-hydroxyacyl-[acyl-carrier-protein] dehydratase